MQRFRGNCLLCLYVYNPFILINIGQFTLGVFDVKIILPYSYSANVPGQYI